MDTNQALDLRAAAARELADYNRDIEARSATTRLNESYLAQKIMELDDIGSWNPKAFLLTTARLTELVLLCAGGYADGGECRAAGDLLLNPRRIVVHRRDKSESRLKKRHTALTEQFHHVAAHKTGVIDWLARETVLEIEEPPLLPGLWKRLTDTDLIADWYLTTVDRRMKKIADVIGLVASCHCLSGLEFWQFLRDAPASDGVYIESQLCRFDRALFETLGREVNDVLRFPDYHTRFLRKA